MRNSCIQLQFFKFNLAANVEASISCRLVQLNDNNYIMVKHMRSLYARFVARYLLCFALLLLLALPWLCFVCLCLSEGRCQLCAQRVFAKIIMLYECSDIVLYVLRKQSHTHTHTRTCITNCYIVRAATAFNYVLRGCGYLSTYIYACVCAGVCVWVFVLLAIHDL